MGHDAPLRWLERRWLNRPRHRRGRGRVSVTDVPAVPRCRHR